MARFDQISTVYLVGIGGTAMGSFAGLLRGAGYAVRGSDENVYPPMSDQLTAWGIPYAQGYRAENLDPVADLIVVGNVIRASNPEAERARRDGLNQASFPETLGALFLAQRHSVVVAGTHGKTTTATLIAHTLRAAGRDPSYLIGGVPQDGGESFRLGGGPHFVVEGDEYDTVYWDKVPKFVHYRPRTAVITSVEYDHADIYPDLAAVERAFERLVALIPDDGLLVCAGDHERVRAVAAGARCQVRRYGSGQPLTAADAVEDESGLRLAVRDGGRSPGTLQVALSGPHGVENALAAYAVCRHLGLDHAAIARGFAEFGGVKRRLEVRGTVGGVTVVDDFAHHPTAVRVTLEGARRRFAGRRLWALFEPRSATSARRVFQEAYALAFDAADQVIVARSGRRGQLAAGESLDERALAAAIVARGKPARHLDSVDEIAAVVVAEARPGDVIICMSNGAFGGIHQKLLTALTGPSRRE
ncbi:MAG: UDP-N-acetylmuramate:L-alanyl-gamma-D-glutamyl-meso-diaminopimelate ligase [Deltaproteobacteria bacterium]|nr:UDP-N-acetylmuramate:L-alanyl-gamma-D-glutamyl-meso-diaminopimelate ligase [Deltaproteobacteria bacterium]